MPVVAPKIPRERLVGFAGEPSVVFSQAAGGGGGGGGGRGGVGGVLLGVGHFLGVVRFRFRGLRRYFEG
jgi:hypothetical protein